MHFETYRSLPMHVYKIESLKSYSEGWGTQVLKSWHAWGTVLSDDLLLQVLLDIFAHLQVVMWKLLTRQIPVESGQGRMNMKGWRRRRWDVRRPLELIKKTLQSRKTGKSVEIPRRVQSGTGELEERWRDGEGRLRAFEINQEDSSKSENWNFCISPRSSIFVECGAIGNTRWWSRKGPDESGNSQKWKADTRLGGGYYGSTSRRMFCTNFSHFPSVVSKQNREN